ncbi:MAG: nucleoid-associated protein [Shewanella xiamenensis]
MTEEVELLIQSKKGKQISINSVAKKIISNLPDNVDNMTAEDFLTFVNENEYKISEVFDVTRGQLQKATNIEGQKGQDYFYRVKRTALGSMRDIDKSIRYDVETRTLYIDVLDEDKHKELMAAISSEE